MPPEGIRGELTRVTKNKIKNNFNRKKWKKKEKGGINVVVRINMCTQFILWLVLLELLLGLLSIQVG